jgi:phosphoribosylformylglycinamidine synthase
MMSEELLQELIKNGQTVWRYCDSQGEIKDEFPTNPNGAIYNLAGVCNPEGNVMSIMPHPERTKDGQCIFEGMREYIVQSPESRVQSLKYQPQEVGELTVYQSAENSVEIFVDLIITDNEARTLAGAIHGLGYTDVEVKKKGYWEIEIGARGSELGARELEDFIKEIILSNELLNTSKEIAYVKFSDGFKKFNKDGIWSAIKQAEVLDTPINYLVKYKDDVVGQSKLATLTEGLGIKGVAGVTKRVVWQVSGPQEKVEELVKRNIFANPYSQEIQKLEI